MPQFSLALLLFCLVSPSAYSQKWRIGQPPPRVQPGVDYPAKMHISEIHLRDSYYGNGQSEAVVYTDVLLNGKKFELCGTLEPYPGFHIAPPLPGDYQGRLFEKINKKNPTPSPIDPELGKEYELVLHDGALWRARVTGISE